ncbi:YdaU family protein [Bartonella doshiae]|uniref:YdaU family protein n=1 Tax=Bartonella doshiae TaxID=33044 RepID=UPI001ABA8C56|nr:DUF1376 domain-containing protein [Bartonella doshiae]
MKDTNQQETPNYESSTLPYVCWYQNDFLGGVRGMRAHEVGIYTILLNEMYARGRPLELSVQRLARLCGCDKRTFLNVLKMLIEEGKILNLENGLWNKRCEKTFSERSKLLEQKSFAGRSSAQKRKKINDHYEQLLNKSTRDDERNSEAQRRGEKETPNGVSEKKFSLIETKAEETWEERAEPCVSVCSPRIVTKQDMTGNMPHTNALAPAKSLSSTSSPAGNIPHTNEKTINSPSSSRQDANRTKIPKGHRLPADWTANISAAISEGLSEEQARWQEKKFRDYWHAKSGKEALKVDWQATWRNWFRREIERLKEHQEKLALLSARSPLAANHNDKNAHDALYKSLINYDTI